MNYKHKQKDNEIFNICFFNTILLVTEHTMILNQYATYIVIMYVYLV